MGSGFSGEVLTMRGVKAKKVKINFSIFFHAIPLVLLPKLKTLAISIL